VDLRIFLRDRNEGLAAEWRKAFADQSEVEVSRGDIFDIEADAIAPGRGRFPEELWEAGKAHREMRGS
jgi:hypothetical protein